MADAESARIAQEAADAEAERIKAEKAQAQQAPAKEAPAVEQAVQETAALDLAPTKDETVITMLISKAEYDKLRADQDMLHALQEAGVDNWDGYSEALEILKSWGV